MGDDVSRAIVTLALLLSSSVAGCSSSPGEQTSSPKPKVATKYDDITKHTTYTFSGPNGLVVSAELEVLDDGWRITVNGK